MKKILNLIIRHPSLVLLSVLAIPYLMFVLGTMAYDIPGLSFLQYFTFAMYVIVSTVTLLSIVLIQPYFNYNQIVAGDDGIFRLVLTPQGVMFVIFFWVIIAVCIEVAFYLIRKRKNKNT